MKIYSPSQTTSFIDCPAEWRLDRHGWRRKAYDNKELAAILGDAFHLAHGEYYRAGAPERTDELVEDLTQQARKKVVNELELLDSMGFECKLKSLDLRNALPLKAQTLVARWLRANKVPRDWDIVSVEHMLTDYGYCKLDLTVRPKPVERLAILDAKVKLRLEKKDFARELDKFAFSWQFMHYTWAAQQHHEEPVKDYFVMMVVLEPGFHIELEHYTVDPELMQLWEQSAKACWAIMAAIEGDPHDLLALTRADEPVTQALYPWHGFDWFTRWGRRPMTDAFLRHRLHDHLMREEYINVKEETK